MTYQDLIENKKAYKYMGAYSRQKFNSTSLDSVMSYEDFFQEVSIKVYDSIHMFNEEKGDIFKWLTVVISTKLLELIRYNSAKIRDYKITQNSLSFDYESDSSSEGGEPTSLKNVVKDNESDFEVLKIENEKAKELLEYLFKNNKHIQDRHYIIGALNGVSFSEVNRQKGYKHSTYTSSMRRLRKLAKKFYEVNKINMGIKEQ